MSGWRRGASTYARSEAVSGRLRTARFAFLVLPAVTFGLGSWQVARRAEKERAIARLETRTSAAPRTMPSALRFSDAELVALADSLEFCRVRVRGRFLGSAADALRVAPRQCSCVVVYIYIYICIYICICICICWCCCLDSCVCVFICLSL